MTRDKTSFSGAAPLKCDRVLAIFLNSRLQLFLRRETALSILSLFADIYKLMSSVDAKMLSSNESFKF